MHVTLVIKTPSARFISQKKGNRSHSNLKLWKTQLARHNLQKEEFCMAYLKNLVNDSTFIIVAMESSRNIKSRNSVCLSKIYSSRMTTGSFFLYK